MNNSSSAECVVRLRYLNLPLDYSYYICGPIMAAIIVMGLLGNTVCLTVFLKTRPMPVVNFYAIPLCICDCAVLIGAFLISNLPHLLYGRTVNYGPYVPIYPYATFFANFTYTNCVWLVVLLSVERYFAVCHPFKHKIYDAKRRSLLVTVFCFITAFVYNIPRYFQFNVFACFELSKREYVSFLEEAEFQKSKPYWIVYKVVLSPLLFSVGPILALCFLSVRMVIVVKRIGMLIVKHQDIRTPMIDKNLHRVVSNQSMPGNRSSPTNRSISCDGNSVKTHSHKILIDKNSNRSAHNRLANVDRSSPTNRSITHNRLASVDRSSPTNRSITHNRLANVDRSSPTNRSITHNRLASVDRSSPTNRSVSSNSNSFTNRSHKKYNDQSRVLTSTMLCVILKFLIFHTIPAVLDICESFMDDDQKDQRFYDQLIDTSNLLVVINSSANIFLFMICNRKFRRRVERHLSKSGGQSTVAV